MINQTVRCDICGRGTKINLQEKKHTGGKREVYFNCEHCSERYTSFVTDTRVRKWQKEMTGIKDPVQRFNMQLKINQRMHLLKEEIKYGKKTTTTL
ncbi:hypothetical protein M3936_16410 [Sutcliffiella horikoshii]|uniref:hypothetical protein n=1 Tax=Sutcliffiella horikoshii TaxID=79883 RepID=UPI00203EFCC1|nr:hypothetical protein [Sutcliffiella horikoshii]MCM3619173.1 hypothetical protein [Sutcliffiella horikoshii]